MEELKYIVAGCAKAPTDAQNVRAQKNGGWKVRNISGVPLLWNPCVSPPFAGKRSAKLTVTTHPVQ